jgi:hypothetical protein
MAADLATFLSAVEGGPEELATTRMPCRAVCSALRPCILTCPACMYGNRGGPARVCSARAVIVVDISSELKPACQPPHFKYVTAAHATGPRPKI